MTAQYDAIGDRYRSFKETAALPVPEARLFTELLGDVHGLRVLDLACGHGHYTRKIRNSGAKSVLGVDVSPRMVRAAQDSTSAGDSAVTYVVGDAEALPELGVFDVVTAVWLFNYADSSASLHAMLDGVGRSLAPGGRLVAITVHPAFDPRRGDWLAYGLRTSARALPHRDRLEAHLLSPEGDLPILISRWDAAVYAEAATAAGLTEVAWHLPEIPEAARAERGDAFWAAYTANPFVAGLTAWRQHS